ncbi:MAG: DUF177 domain-containing protein [Oscillospiraceae bacterium]|nr:DUF177 domain-containing protein [Oscillospiraceae bacterium]MDD4413861.1 DUF177 domain-containing protein [Oscillospiraceae bacterium]
MFLDLRQLFTGERDSLPVDCTLDFSELEYMNNHPFMHPVRVTGEVSVVADVVTLVAVADFIHEYKCDRCLAEVHKSVQMPIKHVLVTSHTQENDDELVAVENYLLPLDDLVREDLILNLPSKNLCREDCRGICPNCGKELADSPCGCSPKAIDPRLEILKQLTES